MLLVCIQIQLFVCHSALLLASDVPFGCFLFFGHSLRHGVFLMMSTDNIGINLNFQLSLTSFMLTSLLQYGV